MTDQAPERIIPDWERIEADYRALLESDTPLHGVESDISATVIEVKDGSKGYNHVRRVRKALLWTSAGDALLDGTIESACEAANVLALPWQSMRSLVAMRQVISEMVHGRSTQG